jgi:hypothetical protein
MVDPCLGGDEQSDPKFHHAISANNNNNNNNSRGSSGNAFAEPPAVALDGFQCTQCCFAITVNIA